MVSKQGDEKSHVDFIICVDENGHEITHTCGLKDVFYPAMSMSILIKRTVRESHREKQNQ